MVIWWCGILLSKAFFKGKFLPPTNHWLTEMTGKSAESFDSWPIFWRPIMVEGNKQFCLDLIWLHSVMSSTDWSVEKLEEIDLTSKPPGRQVLLVVTFLSCEKAFHPCFSIHVLKIRLVDTQNQCLGNNKHLDLVGRLVAQLQRVLCCLWYIRPWQKWKLMSIFSSDLECPDKKTCKWIYSSMYGNPFYIYMYIYIYYRFFSTSMFTLSYV